MAQKRMFSKQIVSTDAFLEMPQSSQLLYFHLNMEADDDGFVSSPKKVMRVIGSGEDDFKILIAKRFIIPFENGICVIKHWLIHNYIRKDTYTETNYLEEKKQLEIKENRGYTEIRQRAVNEPSTQYRLDKIRLDKIREEGEEIKSAEALTPSKINHKFFEDEKFRKEYVRDTKISDNELNKFVSYWTEPNKSGTKVRWELEKTFDVIRRIRTWTGNNFSKEEEIKVISDGKGFIK